MRLWIDGATTRICYIFEGQKPVICTIGSAKSPVTNNQGEYLALIYALEEANRQGIQDLDVYSDSELMVKQLRWDEQGVPEYATKNKRLKLLNESARLWMESFYKISLSWIPREENPAGHILEKRALLTEKLREEDRKEAK